jgi:hypothetical protein
LSEEGDKLFGGMKRGSLAQHSPSAGIERGKQRDGSMPIIFKAVSLCSPGRQRQHPVEPVECLGDAAAASVGSAIVRRPARPVEDLGFERRGSVGQSPATMEQDSRSLITRVGTWELRVPQDREGWFFHRLFERYQQDGDPDGDICTRSFNEQGQGGNRRALRGYL